MIYILILTLYLISVALTIASGLMLKRVSKYAPYEMLFLVSMIPIINLTMALISIPLEFQSIREFIEIENKLYKCRNRECNKLFRRYQSKLSDLKSNSRESCPHCESSYQMNGYYEEDLGWTRDHSDCRRIGLFRILKLSRDIKKIEKIKENIRDIDTYVKYQRETGRL